MNFLTKVLFTFLESFFTISWI